MTFLPRREPRPLKQECPAGIRPEALHIGAGAQAIEVAVFRSERRVARPELRQVHSDRVGRRATPIVVVVLWGEGRAALAGPAGGELAVAEDVDADLTERICESALAAPDRHTALRFLHHAIGQLDAPIPGLRNEGLFALHELVEGVPTRPDWRAAGDKAKPAAPHRGRALIQRLGFAIQDTAGPASILLAQDTRLAMALFLERPEEIDAPSPRFDNKAPISHALARADRENLEYVVVSAGSSLRVYPVRPTVGVGRRGRTETYVELNLDLLRGEHAAYLWLLCSADALAREGSFVQILARSADYAADLGTRLRERVYDEVVPQLARALVRARRLRSPSAEKLRETYEMALLVLFRLLFVAYAEDKDLLPLHAHPEYRRHSLKELAIRLAEARRSGTEYEDKTFLWNEITQLWKAVDEGNRAWGVPAYDGGLFASEDGAGAVLAKVVLTDVEVAPALAALLLDHAEGVEAPVDFRSLGVREFGTIYEGLLESELSVAETDLAVDPRTSAYVPVSGRAQVEVREGEVYLHDASGARKASGAYYTKDFAVEHLLDKALEPALSDHLERVGALDDPRAASEAFFQFHVADIAMGSGHFLVAAIDHIERRFSSYLVERRLPGVADELERLRQEALKQLGAEWAGDSLEETQLLRRQIARRCIFGVDLNPLAVELARLSIWIHTFVPGLPLSLLDANLVVGNSLVGIATFDEARDVLQAEDDLFGLSAENLLKDAREPIERLGRLAEATAAEVKEAKRLHAAAVRATQPARDLLTVLTASRVDDDVREAVESRQVATRFKGQGDVFSDALVRRAERALKGLQPLHFPVTFPQVFLGKRAGFDAMLGNPPWEKAQVEEHEFWARHYPGFRGTSQAEREQELPRLQRSRPDLVASLELERASSVALRSVLLNGPFPGMGASHPDLYKAFCWRFWQLASSSGGRIGVVLPRAAMSAKGSEQFRLKALLTAKHLDVTMLLNTGGWVFDEAEHRYTIALVAAARGARVGGVLQMHGPYASLPSYRAGVVREPVRVPVASIREWNDSASLPLLPSERSAEVFLQMRRSPRLSVAGEGRWEVRPVQGDLNATLGRGFMDFEASPSKTRWPVRGGESFDLWTPDAGPLYAVADAKQVCAYLQERRLASARKRNGAYWGFPPDVVKDPSTLPCRHARIAFRDVSRATDSRTVRACLIPPSAFMVHNAPYFVWPRGDRTDEAYVLGVVCSLVFDWYARRYVETHVTFDLLMAFPVPLADSSNRLRQRLVAIAARMATQDERFEDWGNALHVKPQSLGVDQQSDLASELDAVVGHLFGLSEAQLVHLFQTFHEGWDYQDQLDATLTHFHRLKGLA